MIKCYKCGTTENLSQKGKTSFICKECRNTAYHAYKHKIEKKPEIKIDDRPWEEIARENHLKIIKAYT